MSSPESGDQGDEAQPLKRTPNSRDPVSLSPTDRLVSMTRERIDALERDNRRLRAEVNRLLPYVADKARLEEALGAAELIDLVATILIGLGGFLVSYATFTGKMAQAWANFAGGCLASGVVILLGQSARRWRGR